jgi:hypothetical protein
MKPLDINEALKYCREHRFVLVSTDEGWFLRNSYDTDIIVASRVRIYGSTVLEVMEKHRKQLKDEVD